MKKEIKINNSYTFKSTQILLKDLLNIIDIKNLHISSESNDFTPFNLNLYLYKNNVLDGVEHWQIKNSFKLDEIKDMYYVHGIFIMNKDCLSIIVSHEKPEENKYSVDKAKIDLPKFKDYLKNCIKEGLEKFGIESNIFDGIEKENDLK